MKSLSVEVGAECNDLTVLCLISLKAFKYSLCILKYACILAHDDHIVIDEGTLVPSAVGVVSNETLVGLLVRECQI